MRTFVFGPSLAMQELERKIRHLSRSSVPVLIEGETGTGKETLARQMHAIAPEAASFVRIPCASGAFWQVADDADHSCKWIFFKSVNRLDAPAQEHLLSALDRNMVQGTGARVISSSAQPLDSLVAQNRFHAALFHHLAGVRVAIPALRERPGDIPELFRIFVQEHATAAAVNLPVPSDRLLHALTNYRWPGNGLELSNLAATFAVSDDEQEIIDELQRRVDAHASGPASLPLKEQVRRASRELESGIILRTLQNHRWNRRRAAASLNISYRSLLYKMKLCDLRGDSTTGEVGK